MSTSGRPSPDEYAPFYAGYVALVPEDDAVAALDAQLDAIRALLGAVPEAESLVRHAPYTWSVRDVVGHMTDAERIFGHRALRFARGDATPLPGFDEGAYVVAAGFDRTPLADLSAQFEAARRSNLLLLRGLDPDRWTLGGEANGSFVTVRALAAILVGHARHHEAILRRRLATPGAGS